MTPRKPSCRNCGEKAADDLPEVCYACWNALPLDLQRGWHEATPREFVGHPGRSIVSKDEALQDVLDWWAGSR